MENSTIVAISTAVANAGISIVRLSGNRSFEIVSKLMKISNIENIKSHTIKYGKIYYKDEVIDEVLVSFMKAPKTYTREDVVEINCHGGINVTKKVLETVISSGATIAEPGEFTKRAFLNGRIDLSQAEAVMDLIKADNDYAIKMANKRLVGGISEKLNPIKDEILSDVAYIEASLDDPEHIEFDRKNLKIKERIKNNIVKLENIIENSKKGKIIKNGIKTVIVGKPNVGKSSFLNYISGEEVAIVTEIEGTTRDVISENISLGDISLNIFDTAGIRETDNKIEKIGIEKAKLHIEDAELIILILDASSEITEEDIGVLNLIKDKKSIILFNKVDKDNKIDRKYIEKNFNKKIIEISAKEKYGLEELEKVIKEMFFIGEIDFNNEVFLSNIRQEEAIKRAVESLKLVLNTIENGLSEDFYTVDLMNAYYNIGDVTGDTTSEDLIDKIFNDFCMGK